MANGVARNTSVTSINLSLCNNARVLFDALAAALPSNSTLQHFDLDRQINDDIDYLPAVFLALGNNVGLKSLKVAIRESMDGSLSID
jgi:hypothetical protein